MARDSASEFQDKLHELEPFYLNFLSNYVHFGAISKLAFSAACALDGLDINELRTTLRKLMRERKSLPSVAEIYELTICLHKENLKEKREQKEAETYE